MNSSIEKLCFDDVPSVLLVAAHPDDEVIGAGAQLPRWRNLSLLHITDGAPHNPDEAHAAGFDNKQDYARARRLELQVALRLIACSNPGEEVLPKSVKDGKE